MRRYNKISLLMIFTVILCISVLGTVSAADTANSNTGPTVTANLTSGTYNTSQTVALTTNDSSATTYYTKDSTDPRNSSTRITYTTPITINTTATLRYAAVDSEGNWSQLYTKNYVIGNGTLKNNTGQSNYTGPQTNTTFWTYSTGTGIDGTSVVGSDGTIYVGTFDGESKSGCLYAFYSNGTLKWVYNTYGGIRGSPSLGADGTIYVGSYWGIVYAINPDGTTKWSYDTYFQDNGKYRTTLSDRTICGSPTVGADGTIYIGADNGGKLYAINLDGTTKWKCKTSNIIYGSPAIGSDGTIYLGCLDFVVYAINPNGTIKWTHKTGAAIYGSPSIGSDGTIYVSSQDGNLYAFNPDGTIKWTFEHSGYCAPSIGKDGTIYLESWSCIYALNPDGTVKWTYSAECAGYGPITIGADGTIYFGCLSSLQVYGVDESGFTDLYALNSNGTLKWSYHVGGVIGGITVGPDGSIYVGTRATENFYAFKDVPVAGFTSNTTGDTPLTVHLTDNSTNNPTSWSWDFGDGTSSNSQNPTHTYTKTGTYKVTLTVTNCYGNDTKISYVTVTDITPPTVNVSLQGGNYYSSQSFTLKASETATIYYTTDGSTPTTSSTKYTRTIGFTTSKTLKFFAVDAAGNTSPVYTQRYNIYKLMTYTYKVNVTWKKVWAKVKWKKIRGKWRYHWVKVWKYKTITKTGTKWVKT